MSERRHPCHDIESHNYTGCVGTACPAFDPWRPLPGCLFYSPRAGGVSVARGITLEEQPYHEGDFETASGDGDS